MKTAIYIEDGVVQLVITPESDFEKNAMKTFEGKEVNAKIYSGGFYDCRGGWIRQNSYFHPHIHGGDHNEKSLILTMKEQPAS